MAPYEASEVEPTPKITKQEVVKLNLQRCKDSHNLIVSTLMLITLVFATLDTLDMFQPDLSQQVDIGPPNGFDGIRKLNCSRNSSRQKKLSGDTACENNHLLAALTFSALDQWNYNDKNHLSDTVTSGSLNSKNKEKAQRFWSKWRYRLILSWFPIKLVDAIRLIRLDSPNSIQAGQPLRLRCIYETRGDKLQSLSWYKNGREFYRYQPFERRQPVLAFNLTGVIVDIARSRNNTVHLTNTTSETSGRYKCEVTATTFQEANMDTYINVFSAPTSGAFSTFLHPDSILINFVACVILFLVLINQFDV